MSFPVSPWTFCTKLPIADGATPIDFTFEEPVPTFNDVSSNDLESTARLFYHNEAKRFLNLLQKHAPGGFVDALFAELAFKKACIYRVASV